MIVNRPKGKLYPPPRFMACTFLHPRTESHWQTSKMPMTVRDRPLGDRHRIAEVIVMPV